MIENSGITFELPIGLISLLLLFSQLKKQLLLECLAKLAEACSRGN
jgi:hypothetical protein